MDALQALISKPITAVGATPPARVLVVDDERINRELLAAMLTRAGYVVERADSGAAALEQLVHGHDFDVVLLDLVMPEMDGLTALAKIRETQSTAQLPVIMCTAATDSKQIVTCFAGGANDYITKPIDVPVALARIRTQVEHRQTQQALQASEERYALASIGSNDGLWDYDAETGNTFYSPRWKKMLGLNDVELPPTIESWHQRIHPDDRQRVERLWEEHTQQPIAQFESEHRVLHAEGSYRWMLCRGAAVRDEQGRALRIAGSLTDVTQAKVSDPLTGLPNRLLFLDRLQHCIDRCKREQSGLFAVLFLDLDHFKLINDTFGHEAGDQLLIGMSHRIVSAVRCTDRVAITRADADVARLGGDEFTVLLDSIATPEDAQKVAERILEALRDPLQVVGTQVYVNVSIGISIGNGDDRSAQDYLREADTAMYHAKSSGRNRCCMFDPTMQARAAQRLSLERDLRDAVMQEQFVLQYQPIVHLRTGETIGVEALVRWNHPERGIVPPNDFIALAEETGLILPLGDWVVRKSCQQMAQWSEQLRAHQNMTISINCSRLQLAKPDFVTFMKRVFDESQVDPRSVKLEVTETVLMENPTAVAQSLAQLRALGVKVALDDFGTGYSCLSMLHRLPLDVLKIDRSFVMELTNGEHDLAVVRTILGLAHSLRLSVVAEGIETEEQRNVLDALGCEFGQGYLFSHPVNAEVIESHLGHPGTSAASQFSVLEMAEECLQLV